MQKTLAFPKTFHRIACFSSKILFLLYIAIQILSLIVESNSAASHLGDETLQLGSLDQTSFLDLTSIATQDPKLKTSRLSNINSRRGNQNNQRLNVSETYVRKSSDKKQEEVLSTDCRAKRNEILTRQSSPSGARASQNTSPALTGYQRLKPKHEGPSSPAPNNETITNFGDGEHIPKCNQQGGYEPIQCHKIGYCWCVNKYGQAIKNSAVVAGEEPYCDQSMYESESNDLLVVAGISAQRIKNLLKPGSSSTESTTPNGHMNFEADSSTESLDSDGRQLVGTEFNRRTEPILPLIPNNCKTSRTNAKDRASKHVSDSIWVPDCDTENDRLYAVKQCHKSKVCWCVDQITGLPLRTGESITLRSSSNCTEIKKIVEMTASIARVNVLKSQPAFYHGSSEFCDADKRIEFVTSLNNQFRQQISDYMKQYPASSLPQGLSSTNPFTIGESQVSKWKFTIMDKDLDGKLGDREWSKFKNNFKLVDKLDEMENQFKQQKNSYFSLTPLMILRSQRKCWRDFLEFCGNGDLLNDESISLSKWLSCTDIPPKYIQASSDDRSMTPYSENTYAHSREAAIIRSKKKNPFLGILKPD